jgi:hypothetical protein
MYSATGRSCNLPNESVTTPITCTTRQRANLRRSLWSTLVDGTLTNPKERKTLLVVVLLFAVVVVVALVAVSATTSRNHPAVGNPLLQLSAAPTVAFSQPLSIEWSANPPNKNKPRMEHPKDAASSIALSWSLTTAVVEWKLANWLVNNEEKHKGQPDQSPRGYWWCCRRLAMS